MPKPNTVRRLYWTAILTAAGWHVVGLGALLAWALSEPTSTSSSSWSYEGFGYLFVFLLCWATVVGIAAGIAAVILAILIRRAKPVQGSVPPATPAGRLVGLSSWAAFGSGTAGVLIWWLMIFGGSTALIALM